MTKHDRKAGADAVAEWRKKRDAEIADLIRDADGFEPELFETTEAILKTAPPDVVRVIQQWREVAYSAADDAVSADRCWREAEAEAEKVGRQIWETERRFKRMFDLSARMPKWKLGTEVQTKAGPEWEGWVVGYFSTDLVPRGYVVESFFHKGSVKLFPEKMLRKDTRPGANDFPGEDDQ